MIKISQRGFIKQILLCWDSKCLLTIIVWVLTHKDISGVLSKKSKFQENIYDISMYF